MTFWQNGNNFAPTDRPTQYLTYVFYLPAQTGSGLLQFPLLQVMMLTPFSLKPRRQPNVTFFPCLKSPPLLKPFDRAPGLAQFSVQKTELASSSHNRKNVVILK